jgi:Tol biopolymer transport system component
MRSEPTAAAASAMPTYEIAFSSQGPINADMFIADADGNGATPLLPHAGFDGNASFSRDGQWIVFTSERDGSYDIYRARPDGSALERLVDDPAYDDQATLSPDGRSLAFVSSRSGQADIWILELAWSPDGEWLAFTSARGGFKDEAALHPGNPQPYGDVYVMRADGSDVRQLTDTPFEEGTAAWAPLRR